MNKNSIALGTFDGFHIGHIAVISKAKQSEYPCLVLLFDEHPMKTIMGKAPAKLITDGVLKRLCKENNINCSFINFKSIADMTPEQFFEEILIDKLNAGEITCGENYTFGKGGKGNCNTLKELCEKNNIKCNIIKTVNYKNESVSSTRLRALIENGEMKDVTAMLSRPFSYSFKVIGGNRIGRTLHFPTANQIIPESFVQLKHGVYASAVEIDGTLYPAVTNFGYRPTVDGKNLVSETYIHGFSGDLYGQELEIKILEFLRQEQKFSNTDRLSEAIKSDCEKSIEIFNNALEISE